MLHRQADIYIKQEKTIQYFGMLLVQNTNTFTLNSQNNMANSICGSNVVYEKKFNEMVIT